MGKLTLNQGGVEHAVAQYAMPIKGTVVKLSINGQAVEGRVTNARGRTYTYFAYNGGEFYVAGELAADTPISFELPADFKARDLKSRAAAYEVVKANRAAKKAAEPADPTPEQAAAAAQWEQGQAAA